MVAADAEGWVVSMTPSGAWNPAVIAGRTGIGLSQRMQGFVLDEAENPYNVLVPGKQPRVTLTPTLSMKDGQPHLAFAVQGGDTQDQNLLQFFLNVVEFGMNVQQAAEAPNVNSHQLRSSFGAHESRPGRLTLAASTPEAVRTELEAMGYTLVVRADHVRPHQRGLLRPGARHDVGRVEPPRRGLRDRLVAEEGEGVPHLRLASGNGPSEIFALRGDRVVLGRAHECDLILPDVLLSRRHAEIVHGPQGWVLRDLGSLNGTRLNGIRVQREEPLHDGDQIGMSDWVLVYRDAATPSDPGLAEAGARLRDVTDLATRSGLEAGALARQSRILGVLTRAAAAVVATPSPEILLESLLVHLLEAVPGQRGLVALLEGQPPAWTLAAVRAIEGPPPVAVDPAVAERVLRTQAAFIAPRVAAEDGASGRCSARRCGSAAPGRAPSASPAAWPSRAPPTPRRSTRSTCGS